jgi:guanylate kinase
VAGGPLLVVITGPSGVGKDSILARLKTLGKPYHFTVTATTRAPRQGERDGVDYYFVSEPEFERMRNAGELLEHAMVYGQHKGVPKAPIREALARGQDVLMRTDIQGARTIKSLVPSAITIFVSAPNDAEMVRRLRTRASETDEELETRLRVAEKELAAATGFDYAIVNENLDHCAAEVEEILASERQKSEGRAVRI